MHKPGVSLAPIHKHSLEGPDKIVMPQLIAQMPRNTHGLPLAIYLSTDRKAGCGCAVGLVRDMAPWDLKLLCQQLG